MKLLLKQYLASLNERDELDVVLPDILSEVGFTVISRPKRGTTQYGVDVAAIGSDPVTGEKALFLLSIKSGDLTRNDWATGKQALRPSLEEMIEVYIPKHLPARYKDLPIIVALCFGGDIQEDVRLRVDGFIDKNTDPGKLKFEEWNGDHIAELIATGILRETFFREKCRTHFARPLLLWTNRAFVSRILKNYFDSSFNHRRKTRPRVYVSHAKYTWPPGPYLFGAAMQKILKRRIEEVRWRLFACGICVTRILARPSWLKG